MGSKNAVVGDVKELAFFKQFKEVLRLGLHPEHHERVMIGLKAITEPRGSSVKTDDLAAIRQSEMHSFFHNLGFTHIIVPKPNLSNRKIRDGRKQSKELFYRPATKDMTHQQLMIAVGQNDHWTVTNKADIASVGWEDTKEGYWFWAEDEKDCPRLGTSQNDLTKKVRLLSLEEYVIVWWERRKAKNIVLDRSTVTWFRTRWNTSGALRADGCDGVVFVSRDDVEDLALSHDDGGGRLAEVIH